MIENGFCEVFPSYNDAYVFWEKNRDNVEKDCSIGISYNAPHTVSCYKIRSKIIEHKPDMSFKSRAADYSQSLDGVLNPADGKRYDTKANYYKAVKESGSHIIEAGESAPKRDGIVGDYNVRAELTQATREVLSRRN